MAMLIERIPAEELEMIDTYRKTFAFSEDAHDVSDNFCDISYLLREWDAQKSKSLFQLLGGELIVSRNLTYEKSYEELQEEIADFTDHRYGRVGRSGREFFEAYSHLVNQMGYTSFPLDIRRNLNRLISDDCLISNKYDGPAFNLDTEDGKVFKVLSGCKVSKALGKIAQIFNLPGYEDFRICHSQVLNQKALNGKLSLSIHPLDYMTLSDNECDWDSCMSWRNEGGYRQGTVEMMNSPCVVVAYLSAAEDMRIWMGHGHDDQYRFWNNKKWRQLFIVDRNVIMSIKDYPYHNDDLTKTIVEWLRNLAGANLNWTYGDIFEYHYNTTQVHIDGLDEDHNDFCVEMTTEMMYNDCGCLDYHWMCFNQEFDGHNIQTRYNGRNYWPFHYSGTPQCMICGGLDMGFSDESCLACCDCQDRARCDCCGELICGDPYHVDGVCLCEYCWDNRTHQCEGCGENHYEEDMTAIYVTPRYAAEEQDEFKKFWKARGYNYTVSRHERETPEYVYMNGDPNIWICDSHHCMKEFEQSYLKEGCHVHSRDIGYNTANFVYFDELNEDALDCWFWQYDGSPDLFKQAIQRDHLTPSVLSEVMIC